jgi:hypothetical protein
MYGKRKRLTGLIHQEKRREFNLETHLLFIDYEKTFDNIQREVLFNILKSRHIPDTLLKAIVDIYTQNKILIHLTTNYQNRQKLLKEYAKVALFHLHCLIYI